MALLSDQSRVEWVLSLVESMSIPREGEQALPIQLVIQRVLASIKHSGEEIEPGILDFAFDRHLQKLVQYLDEYMSTYNENEVKDILYGYRKGFIPTFCIEIIETGVSQHFAKRFISSHHALINPPSPTHSRSSSPQSTYSSSLSTDSSSEYDLPQNFHHLKLSSPSLRPHGTSDISSMSEPLSSRPSLSHSSTQPRYILSPSYATSPSSLQHGGTYSISGSTENSPYIGSQAQYTATYPNEHRRIHSPPSPPSPTFNSSRESIPSVYLPHSSQPAPTSPVQGHRIAAPLAPRSISFSSIDSTIISGPPMENASTRISAPDSDERTRSSTFANPPAIGPPPPAPECESFQTKQFCYGSAKCRTMHHVGQTVCRHLTRSRPCTQHPCSMQHPNEVTFHLLKEKVRAILGVEKRDWEAEIQKRKIVFRWDGELTKICRDTYSKCGELDCRRNHVKALKSSSTGPLSLLSPASSSNDAVGLVDVTTRAECTSLVQGLLDRSTNAKFSIVKLIRIDNGAVKKSYEHHIATFMKQKGSNERLERGLVFHGTPLAANCESIAREGFKSAHLRRQAYGTGHYFALTPDVSRGYCNGSNVMLVCEVIHECLVWVKEHSFFVVKDDGAILPQYILHFTAT